jgi:hypothetical protein
MQAYSAIGNLVQARNAADLMVPAFSVGAALLPRLAEETDKVIIDMSTAAEPEQGHGGSGIPAGAAGRAASLRSGFRAQWMSGIRLASWLSYNRLWWGKAHTRDDADREKR